MNKAVRTDDIRFLFSYDRWATERVLAALDDVQDKIWSGSRSSASATGTFVIHHLGATQRWRHAIQQDGEAPRPEDEPLLSIDELRRRWMAEWDAVDAWLPTLDDAFLAHVHEGEAILADARPRRQPRDAAPLRGRGPPHRRRALPRRDLDIIDYVEMVATDKGTRGSRPMGTRMKSSPASRRRIMDVAGATIAACWPTAAGFPAYLSLSGGMDPPGSTCSPRRPATRPSATSPPTSSMRASSSARPSTPVGEVNLVDPAGQWPSRPSRTSRSMASPAARTGTVEGQLGALPREEIAGATAETHEIAAPDLGHRLLAIVQARSNASVRAVFSHATAPAAALPGQIGPSTTTGPLVATVLQQGSKLVGATGAWAGAGAISYAYQWSRCDAAGAQCKTIRGATAVSYTPVAKDVGATLGFSVRGTDATGARTAYASLVGPVAGAGAGFASAGQPTVTGTPTQGQALQVSPGAWTQQPAVVAYQWLRCNENGRACAAIAGATAAAYAPGAEDVGHALVAVVRATAGEATQDAFSTATRPIVAAPGPASTAPPSISGALQQGKQVTGFRARGSAPARSPTRTGGTAATRPARTARCCAAPRRRRTRRRARTSAGRWPWRCSPPIRRARRRPTPASSGRSPPRARRSSPRRSPSSRARLHRGRR